MSKNLPHYTYPQNILVNSVNDVYNIAHYKRIVIEPDVEGTNLLISKINSEGILQWVQEYPSTYSETISSSIIDKDDNIYILIGYNSKYYVRKYDGGGKIMYEIEIERDGQLYNGDDYIYLGSSLKFSDYDVKAIITKFDLNFNQLKTHEIAETHSSWVSGIKYYIKDMKIDNNDNLIVTGQRGSCGKRPPVCLNGDFWLMKFINDSPDWFLIEGSYTDDIPLSLVIDSSNNIYIHGKTKGNLYDYHRRDSEWEGFLSKYDTNGNFIIGKQTSSTSSSDWGFISSFNGSSTINEVKSEIKIYDKKYNLDLSSKESVSYSYTNQNYGDLKLQYLNQWNTYLTLSNDHNLVTIKFSDPESPDPVPFPSPTRKPTPEPFKEPTNKPTTKNPTLQPVNYPILVPTWKPNHGPTLRPVLYPNPLPTRKPTQGRPPDSHTLIPTPVSLPNGETNEPSYSNTPSPSESSLSFSYLCNSNTIEDLDMETKSYMIIFINNKELIDESLEVNLIKGEDVEYMIDDVNRENVPDDYIWIIPNDIKTDNYHIEMKSKNNEVEIDKCNTNTFKIINSNSDSDSTNEASISIELIMVIIGIVIGCIGIYHTLRHMYKRTKSQNEPTLTAVPVGEHNVQMTNVNGNKI